jgi:hypothetical protein
MSEAAGNIVRRPRRLLGSAGVTWAIVLLCLVPAGAYYAALISSNYGDLLDMRYPSPPGLFSPLHYGLTFNSMLLHLLNGAFDVDPQTIGLEGAVRNGLTYSYFGIAMALIRLPFVAARDFATTDFTRLSCLVAASIMGAFNVASVLTVWRAVGRPDRTLVLVFFVFAVLFGGAQIQFLVASIWQEVTLWAAAFASGFVYLVVRGHYAKPGFSARLLAGLAAVAGLCLLTRVSTALGLYLALGLLMLQQARGAFRAAGPDRFRMAALLRFVPAAVILCGFVAIAAIVNDGRWGNPLAFAADMQSYLLATPDRVARDAQYGQFNIVRLGYALAYYFVPVWVASNADGTLLWSALEHRAIDSVELPPASFFISDPLVVGLMLFMLVQLARHRGAFDRAVVVPVLAGLLVPIVLILTYSSMTFRYRLEFYPFFNLCAFLGFGVLASRPKAPPVIPIALAAVVGVIGSHVFWMLYVLGRFGNAADKLGGTDVISFYRTFFQ